MIFFQTPTLDSPLRTQLWQVGLVSITRDPKKKTSATTEPFH